MTRESNNIHSAATACSKNLDWRQISWKSVKMYQGKRGCGVRGGWSWVAWRVSLNSMKLDMIALSDEGQYDTKYLVIHI